MTFSAICRGLALAAALAIAAPAPAAAQTAPQAYDGDWEGVLHAGPQNLRLQLHVKTRAGQTTAVLDSLDQGISAPATGVKVEDGELGILFLPLAGELKGKLSPDGKTITGTWTQEVTLPLTLTKKAAK
jgi:hypothetical protein